MNPRCYYVGDSTSGPGNLKGGCDVRGAAQPYGWRLRRSGIRSGTPYEGQQARGEVRRWAGGDLPAGGYNGASVHVRGGFRRGQPLHPIPRGQ